MSLEDIREKKQSKGVYIVIGLLLVGMAGFGTNQFGAGGGFSRKPLLESGSEQITLREYDNMLRYVQQQNPNLDTETAKKAVLSNLRQSISLADYLARYPFGASNKSVDMAIANNKAFFENGKFSEEVFKKNVPMAIKDYRRSVSKDLAVQEFKMSIIGTTIVSQAELQPYLLMKGMTRDISVAKIPSSNFSATATDKDIEDYYNSHKNEFMTQEKYNIDYIDFNPEEIIKNTPISDDELAKQLVPSREASYYSFKDEQTAKAVFDDVANGKKIKDVIKDLAEKLEESGDLGKLNATVDADSPIPQSAIDSIFALNNVGDVTAPTTVDGAIYLFELTKLDDSISEAEKAQARFTLQKDKAEPELASLTEKLEKAAYSQTSSLENINEETKLPINSTGMVAADSKMSIFAIPEVVTAIGESDKVVGKLQQPIIVGERVIVYRFANIEKPQQKSLADVKADIEKTVVADKIAKEMAKKAEEFVNLVKKDGLDAAAKQGGYDVKTYANFNGKVEKTDLLDPIAALLIAKESPKLGKEKASIINSPMGDSYVYVTDDIRLGDNTNTASVEELQQQVSPYLAMQIGQTELTDFLLSISQRAKIKDYSASLLMQQ